VLASLLAHVTVPDGDGSLALSILLLVGMIIPFIVFGWVAWIFWKAKVREDEARRKSEWQNVRSS
jgi:heme/copper-type cytochrome/quinol oxidase subunit 2